MTNLIQQLLKEALWASLLAFQTSVTDEQRLTASQRLSGLLDALHLRRKAVPASYTYQVAK